MEIEPVFSAKYTNATIRIIGINTAPNKMILAFSEPYFNNNGRNRKPTAMEMPNPNSATCHNGPLNLIPWNQSATTVTVVPAATPNREKIICKTYFSNTYAFFEIGRIIPYFSQWHLSSKVKVVAVIIPHKEAHIIM